MNPRLQKLLYAGLRHSGVLAGSRWWHRRHGLILTYHGVRAYGSPGSRHALTAEMFERQIEYLARYYLIISLAELTHTLNAKEMLPPYTLALTLEGGRRNEITAAVRILQKYKLPATLFLTTAFIGTQQHGLWTERVDWLLQAAHGPTVDFDFDGDARSLALATMRDRLIASEVLREYLKKLPARQREAHIAKLAAKVGNESDSFTRSAAEGYLSWEELRAFQSARLGFGSQTHTGALLSTLSPAEAFYELSTSQRLIQKELQCSCEFFSYPRDTVRAAPARDRDLFKKLRFKAALGHASSFNSGRTDPYALGRFHVQRCPDFNFFLAKIAGTRF